MPAGLSRLFVPLLQLEKWEIHTVFLRFSTFELGQKSWLSLLVKLCGVALEFDEKRVRNGKSTKNTIGILAIETKNKKCIDLRRKPAYNIAVMKPISSIN